MFDRLNATVAALAVGAATFFGAAGVAQADTADFAAIATITTPSLTVGAVTVTGSGDVQALCCTGLGIVGGLGDSVVDSGDIISFSFSVPATSVVMRVLPCDLSGDGTVDLEALIQGTDGTGAAVNAGSIQLVPEFPVATAPAFVDIDIFAILGVGSLSSFDVTMQNDCIRVDSLIFTLGGDPVPVLTCSGFMPPFDNALSLKKKVKRAIPVDIELNDADGYIVTDLDIVAPPVINVLFNGTVFGDVPPDDATLLPLGSANEDNAFRFDPESGQWIYNLGTKQFGAPGTYTVSVASGDTSEYTIDAPGGACAQTFERLP